MTLFLKIFPVTLFMKHFLAFRLSLVSLKAVPKCELWFWKLFQKLAMTWYTGKKSANGSEGKLEKNFWCGFRNNHFSSSTVNYFIESSKNFLFFFCFTRHPKNLITTCTCTDLIEQAINKYLFGDPVPFNWATLRIGIVFFGRLGWVREWIF